MAITAEPECATMARQNVVPVRVPGAGLRSVAWSSLDNPEVCAAWDRLSDCATEPNPFLESWYLLPSLRALDPSGSVRMLRFKQGGALAGLLPMVRSPRYYRWPVPHFSSWVHANCFLGAPLVAAGAERAFWQALLGHADSAAGTALFLHLGSMPLDGPLHDALVAVAGEQGRQIALVHREERALLSTDAAPEAYLEAALTPKKRKELRRQHNRLAELGTLTVERSTAADGLAAWCDDFLALEHSGWKGSNGSALASHRATAALFRESLAGAAARGKLERLALRLDGAPIAMLATFLTPPGAFSYKTAFDERYARFSPGVLLQRENLAVLERPEIAWTDSCAAADHPMIDKLWRERRAIGRLSIAIGGPLRRKLFAALVRAELGRNPAGLA